VDLVESTSEDEVSGSSVRSHSRTLVIALNLPPPQLWPVIPVDFYVWEILCPILKKERPPLWSSCHSSWLQIQRTRVRFPALPNFLRSSGSRTGSTQPREHN
jgi:hypothetical protein